MYLEVTAHETKITLSVTGYFQEDKKSISIKEKNFLKLFVTVQVGDKIQPGDEKSLVQKEISSSGILTMTALNGHPMLST
ncbi:hypothetical protein [Xanthocytophaga flava]|uniref:hypothetical protein n=1 Tax=Xanthocytophaga flava TaxID=3048013 RepID=UPI0028D1DA69|nr:hypothetical protein [Xanthocytophaga flavus]MDJ1467661.1 hypothetical protein [Xanthocytophaga flavus]